MLFRSGDGDDFAVLFRPLQKLFPVGYRSRHEYSGSASFVYNAPGWRLPFYYPEYSAAGFAWNRTCELCPGFLQRVCLYREDPMLWTYGGGGLHPETPFSLLHYAPDLDDYEGHLLGYDDVENALPMDADRHIRVYGYGDCNLYCVQLEEI